MGLKITQKTAVFGLVFPLASRLFWLPRSFSPPSHYRAADGALLVFDIANEPGVPGEGGSEGAVEPRGDDRFWKRFFPWKI